MTTAAASGSLQTMRTDPDDLWLDPVQPAARRRAREAFDAGDAAQFLVCADNMAGLDLVSVNRDRLVSKGIFENALVLALTRCRINNHHLPVAELDGLISHADPNRLRAAGAPLPGPGPFTLYRGVAGRGAARRVRGYSWTSSLEKATWFARRFGLDDPAVFRVVASSGWVLVYFKERGEEEFLVRIPGDAEVRRIWPVAAPGRRNRSSGSGASGRSGR